MLIFPGTSSCASAEPASVNIPTPANEEVARKKKKHKRN